MHNITWLIAETQKINFPSTNRSISYLHVVNTSTIRLCATKPYDTKKIQDTKLYLNSVW